MTRASEDMPLFSVLGMGNVLMGDDGLGPHLVASFRSRFDIPDMLEVEDVGTPGPELAYRVAGRLGVIVIDAVRNLGRPGHIHRFTRQDIISGATGKSASPHDPFLREAILTAEFAGNAPGRIILLGAEVHKVTPRTHLSLVMRSALPVLEELLCLELARWGVPVQPRFPQSDRSATTGSTRVARLAGTADAVSPVPTSTRAMTAKTVGSLALTSKRTS